MQQCFYPMLISMGFQNLVDKDEKAKKNLSILKNTKMLILFCTNISDALPLSESINPILKFNIVQFFAEIKKQS